MDIKLCKWNVKKVSFSTCLYMAHLVLEAQCGERRLSIQFWSLGASNWSCLNSFVKMNIFKVYRNNSKTSFVKVLMQIKSYILVRVTEAWNFVSGLPYQIGFFVSVVSMWSQEQRQALLTCENWPSWHHSFAEDGSSHPSSPAWGGLVRPAATRAWPAAGGTEGPWSASAVAGG